MPDQFVLRARYTHEFVFEQQFRGMVFGKDLFGRITRSTSPCSSAPVRNGRICSVIPGARALPEIQRQAPGITLQILPLRTGALEHSDVDLVILPKQILAKDHPSELLFEDEFVCIACAKNKLIRQSLSVRDYLRLSHVVVRFGEQQEVPSLEETFMGRLGQGRRIEVVATGFTLLPQLILGTTRIATIQRRLAEFYASQMPLKIVKLPKQLPKLQEVMQWHAFRNSDPGLVWLRKTLKSFAV